MSRGERLAAVAAALALACGTAGRSSPCASELRLSDGVCAELARAVLPAQLPAAAGNRFGDSFDAARMGHWVFFDARFSQNLSMRCASCHQAEASFQDSQPSPSIAPLVTRNSPTVINSAWTSHQFWDGRADSLWSQALAAFENPKEMNFTRLEIAHLIDREYRARYEQVFGPLPDFSDPTRFPARGAPGMPAYEAMAAADKATVDGVAANVGKAVEAYERKIAAGRSRVDQYLLGDRQALSDAEKRGLAVFARARCLDCHSGPMLADEKYHNLGVPEAAGVPADPGRAAGVAVLLASPFNASGPYYDGARPEPSDRLEPGSEGAFRTPSLRNLTLTAPYGHNGRFATLEAAVDFHLQGGGRGLGGFAGEVDPLLQPQPLSTEDRDALVALLKALKGDYPQRPWNDWPDR